MLKTLPPREWLDNGMILDSFLQTLEDRGIALYPAQEEAILALYENHNVILNTPTGSGKSLVATALHLKSLAWGCQSVYTCPIKALVNEKFIALCKEFGPANVGIVTGDSSVNADAPILCCTAEILSNMALRHGIRTGIDDVIMDEFHYFSDRERGSAWQIPLLTMPDTRFLLMSATLGDTDFFQKKLTELNGLLTDVIKSSERPVPLDFVYQETPLHETVADLVSRNKAPIYLVHFTQRESAEQAQNFLSMDFCTKEEKKAIAEALQDVRFDSPYGKEIQRYIRHGIGLHHAGLLPKYRILIERLAQQGLLKIICGTDTLGVGVNVPIRTVVFTQLSKFDGEKTAILSVRDFMQIGGRAGRKGFDDQGTVVIQAPEHVIENLRMEQKAAGDPKKTKKIVKKKPPLKGFVSWNKDTFTKLISSDPEQLVSRFKMSHGILLNVLSRERGGVTAMRRLIRECYETEVTRKNLRASAFELFRSLYSRRIIEVIPMQDRSQALDATPLRINLDLQLDFSLNQALSLYLMDTIKLLDPALPDYALRLLSLVESIQDNPEVVLRKQLDKIKTIRMGEMKMEGLDFEDRIAELEKLEYPKPEADFIYNSFNEFQALHPWVAKENIRPKSVAREMYENFQTFDEYIREYDLGRSEGTLLRYLSEVYRALAQTVPDYTKDDEARAIEDYFGSMVRDVDSSLLDEWTGIGVKREASAGQQEEASRRAQEQISSAELAREKKEIRILARNAVFRFVKALGQKDYESACKVIAHQGTTTLEGMRVLLWTDESLKIKMEEFESEHGELVFNAGARAPNLTRITEHSEGEKWTIEQTLLDSQGFNDVALSFELNLEHTRRSKRAALVLLQFGQFGQFGEFAASTGGHLD